MSGAPFEDSRIYGRASKSLHLSLSIIKAAIKIKFFQAINFACAELRKRITSAANLGWSAARELTICQWAGDRRWWMCTWRSNLFVPALKWRLARKLSSLSLSHTHIPMYPTFTRLLEILSARCGKSCSFNCSVQIDFPYIPINLKSHAACATCGAMVA